MDTQLLMMCGGDYPVPECQLILHQPTIKEISMIGEKEFFKGVQTLSISKELISEVKNDLVDTNIFDIFMMIMSDKETSDKKEAVLQLLTLIFPKSKINLTPRSVIINTDNELSIIDDKNFEFFQNAIKEIFCVNSTNSDQQTYNPANKKAQEIVKKIMAGRKKISELKGESNNSMFAQYLSIVTVGINSMSLKDAMNLTMYQILDLIERYNLYISWDIDIQSRLAGADPKNKPENWMKDIH